MDPLGPGRVFAEPRLEKRGTIDRFHEGLHYAAHARRHPAGEDAERDLAPRKRVEANRRKPFVAGGTRRRRIGQIAVAGELDEPVHAIALLRRQTGLTASPREKRSGKRNETLGVESRLFEARAKRVRDAS
jgi:hypothetical protein